MLYPFKDSDRVSNTNEYRGVTATSDRKTLQLDSSANNMLGFVTLEARRKRE